MLKLRGLYYITHIDNLYGNGILCHRKIIEEQINLRQLRYIIALRGGKGF